MATPEQTEAIKLLGDWCKWLVTIETGSIAAIMAVSKLEGSGHTMLLYRCSCTIALASFVASILVTAWTTLSLPTSLQDIGKKESIWDRRAYLLIFAPPTWVLVYWQFLLFILGIVAFAIGSIGLIWS